MSIQIQETPAQAAERAIAGWQSCGTSTALDDEWLLLHADAEQKNRHGAVEESTSRRWLIASVALFAASRLLLLLGPWPICTDVPLYFHYAQQAAEAGKVPYRDFLFEYPPLAWHAMALTDSLARWSGEPSDVRYRQCFHCVMAVCDVVALVLFWSILRRRAGRWCGPLCFSYVLATGLCGYVLYERLDLGLLALLLCWAYAWLKPVSSQRAAGAWWVASYAFLAVSICYKVVPVVMVPYLLVYEWRQRGLARLAAALGTLALATAICFAPLFPSAGSSQFNFVEFHHERGIQVESIYATVLTLASYVGIEKSIVHVYNHHDLAGPWVPALKALSRLLLFGFLSVAGVWALIQGCHFDRRHAYRLACFALLGSAVLANVLSGQYFIWLLPIAMLLAAEIPPAVAWQRWLLLAALVATAGLTLLDFPLTYFDIIGQPASGPRGARVYVGEAAVGLRNFLFAAWVIWLGAQQVRAARLTSAA